MIAGMQASTSASTLRAIRLRFVLAGFHVLCGVVIAGLFFPFISATQRRHKVRRWAARFLGILKVRLHVHGRPAVASALMIVANHVSWLDILVIDAVLPVRFVAKSEVRRWPVIGWLCEKAGTLFIERARRHDTARMNHLIAEAMQAGEPVAVFPEGTATDGSEIFKFHSSLLQPALVAQATLMPVAIRYSRADGTLCTEAAYDGDKSLWDTIKLMGTRDVIHAHVHFLAPLMEQGRSRHELALAARESILLTLFPSAHCSRTE